jgi:hypothetical protein
MCDDIGLAVQIKLKMALPLFNHPHHSNIFPLYHWIRPLNGAKSHGRDSNSLLDPIIYRSNNRPQQSDRNLLLLTANK